MMFPKPTKKPNKRAAQQRRYKKIRDSFLEHHPFCEVCKGKSTEVHHKKGRIGEALTDADFFLAACRSCHRRIEENPTWAKENGYSLNRL